MKLCTGINGCGQLLPYERFNRKTASKDGYGHQCRDCISAYNKARASLVKTKKSEYAKQYYQDNKERLAEYYREYQPGYRERNRHVYNATARRRRARERNQQGYMPKGWFEAMQRTYGYRCAQCGTSENITVDHVVALSNGGLDELSNLQFLCGSHNSAKKNYHNTDYRSVILRDVVIT